MKLKQILLEVTKNDILARQLTSKSLDLMKNDILNRDNIDKEYDDKFELDGKKFEFYSFLTFSDELNIPFHINAQYGKYSHTELYFIGFEIVINPKYKVRDLKNIYFDLLATIRHEIEHYFQRHADDRFKKTRPVEPTNVYQAEYDKAEKSGDYRDYIRLPSEMQGNYKGIRLMAKKMGIPFEQAAGFYFSRMKGIDPAVAKKELIDYILKQERFKQYHHKLKK